MKRTLFACLLLLPAACALESDDPGFDDDRQDTACRSSEIVFFASEADEIGYDLAPDIDENNEPVHIDPIVHTGSLTVLDDGEFSTLVDPIHLRVEAWQSFKISISSPFTDLFTTLQFDLEYRRGDESWTKLDIFPNSEDSFSYFGEISLHSWWNPNMVSLLSASGSYQAALKSNCELLPERSFSVTKDWNLTENNEWDPDGVYEWRIRPFVKSGLGSLVGEYDFTVTMSPKE